MKPSPRSLFVAIPVMLGYFPVAVAFGLLVNQKGFGVEIAIGSSALVFAGASQFAGLALFALKTSTPLEIFTTTLLINLRHFVLSLSYLPYAKAWTFHQKVRFLPLLTDETFAVLSHSQDLRESPTDSLNIAFLNYLSWLVGTVVGFYFGALIPDARRWGIDFALVALFVGIIALFLRRMSHVVTLLLAVGLTFLFYFHWGWHRNSIVLITVLASTGGWLWDRRK